MATVPFSPATPQQTVAPAPVGITPGSASGATPDAFSPTATQEGQQAQANIKNTSDQLALAADRVQKQNDSIARVRGVSAFHEAVSGELNNQLHTGDLADPKTSTDFHSFVAQTAQKTLDNFQGSPEGRAALQASIEPIGSQAFDQLAGQSFVARKAVFQDATQKDLNAHANVVAASPGMYGDSLAAYNSNVDRLLADKSISPIDATAWKTQGAAQLLQTAVSTLTSQGAFPEARAALANADPSIVDPSVLRSMDARISTGEKARNDKLHEYATKLTSLQEVMPKNADGTSWAPKTQDEMLRVMGIASGPVTPAQWVAETNAVLRATGAPDLTPAQILKHESASLSDVPEGGANKDLNFIDAHLQELADGTITPANKGALLSAVENYTKNTGTNPVTGDSNPQRSLAKHITDVLDATGNGPPIPPPKLAVDAGYGQGLYSKAADVTGLFANTARGIAKTPGAGTMFPASTAVEMNQALALKAHDLAALLASQPNQRNSAGNAKSTDQILKELDLTGGLFQPGSNWQNRMHGIDDVLVSKAARAQSILNNPGLGSPSDVKWAKDTVAGVADFRAFLGVPPKITSGADLSTFLRSHPVGSLYRYNGAVKQSEQKQYDLLGIK